jgi:hypothetical protein
MVDAGWYEDPTDNSILRWWDGTQWTSEVSPNPGPSAPPQQGAFDPAFGQQQQQQVQPAQQMAPWEQPVTGENFSYQNPGQEPQMQQNPYASQGDPFAAPQDAYTPPPWPPQDPSAGGFDGNYAPQPGAQLAPWESPAGSFAPEPVDPYATGSFNGGGPDPYAPQNAQSMQTDPWETGMASQQNLLAGYASQGLGDDSFGQSLYEVPENSSNDFFEDDNDSYGPVVGGGASLPALLQGPKRFIVIGGAALLVLVLFMGVKSVVFGGGETAANGTEEAQGNETTGGGGVTPPEQTSESGVPLVQLPAWSKWPSVTLGYVIEYPKPPIFNNQNDRQVFTSQLSGAQYQLTVRSIDPQAAAALSGQERLELARSLILEQTPDASAEQVQNFAETTLGGLPARQVEWQKADGTKVVARFTFTQNRIYLLTGIGPDTERFFDSFGWFREPPTL